MCLWGKDSHDCVVEAVEPLQCELAAAVGRQHEEVVRERRRVLPPRQLVCKVALIPCGQKVVAVCDGDHLVHVAEVCPGC